MALIPLNPLWGVVLAESVGARPTSPDPVTYDGNPHGTGYIVPEGVIATGEVTAITAGEHTATYTPDSDHCWDDDGQDDVNVDYVINKAAGYCYLSAYSFEFDQGNSCSFTINCSGTPYVISSSGCTVTLNDNSGTVTGSTIGSGSFQIGCYESTNYNAATASGCTVTILNPYFYLRLEESGYGCWSTYYVRNGNSWMNEVNTSGTTVTKYKYPSEKHTGSWSSYLDRFSRNIPAGESSGIASELVWYDSESGHNDWLALTCNGSYVYAGSLVNRYGSYRRSA